MRHLKSGRKLNRTASHRKAMLGNLAVSILEHERVTTTTAKAKEVRGVVERLITYGKNNTLHSIRIAAKTIRDKDILKKLFDDIGPAYQDRNGGYTRVIKVGERKGDNAELSIIELVGRNGDEPRQRKKKTAAKPKKVAAKKTAKKATTATKEAEKAAPAEKKEDADNA